MSMHRRLTRFSILVAVLVVGACGFEDLTPENLFFTLTGEAGTPVELIFSTQFNAGVDEQGVTQVSVFLSDTITTVLPVDTVFDISIDRRWFVQATAVDPDRNTFTVRVDVDDRNQISESGLILPEEPWRYAYLFNTPLTRTVDVVF